MTHVRKRSAVPSIMPATVNIRRSYADCRYGQLHTATAYPSGGGFDEKTALICIHASGASARSFAALLPELGRDRSVYALDLPGHGNSDVATGNPTIADYAGAVADFVTSLRIRTFDVMGVEAGALIAAELAATRGPQVRRVVLVSIPYPAQPVRQIAGRSEQSLVAQDVASVADDWQRFAQSRGTNVPLNVLQNGFADHLRAGSHELTLRAAAQEYAVAQRLPLVRVPTLVVCPNDELREQTLRAKSCLSQGSLAELSDVSGALMATASPKVLPLTREFLYR